MLWHPKIFFVFDFSYLLGMERGQLEYEYFLAFTTFFGVNCKKINHGRRMSLVFTTVEKCLNISLLWCIFFYMEQFLSIICKSTFEYGNELWKRMQKLRQQTLNGCWRLPKCFENNRCKVRTRQKSNSG